MHPDQEYESKPTVKGIVKEGLVLMLEKALTSNGELALWEHGLSIGIRHQHQLHPALRKYGSGYGSLPLPQIFSIPSTPPVYRRLSKPIIHIGDTTRLY